MNVYNVIMMIQEIFVYFEVCGTKIRKCTFGMVYKDTND